jgi:hypothetical protein
MKFRIRKQPKGYIVEYLNVKWSLFGLKKEWKPFVLTSGLDCAWHHSNYDFAMINLLDQVKKETNQKTLKINEI